MLDRIKIKELILAFLLIILIFQSFLITYMPILQYYDELLCLFSILYIMFTCILKKQYIKKYFYVVFLLILFFLLYGLICNWFGIMVPTKNMLSDMLLQTKFPITLIGFLLFFKNNWSSVQGMLHYSIFIIIIFIYITFGFGIINFIKPFNSFTSGYRYGLPVFNFIFDSPGTLNALSLFWLVCLTLCYDKNRKYLFIFTIILDMVIMCMTLRARAFVCVGIYFYFALILKYKVNKLVIVIGLIIIVFLLGRNMFDEYFIENDSSQRSLLLKYGFLSMKNRFPFGYGFSTYGSYSSAHNYYSPLYSLYSMNLKYGLTEDNPAVINDNYWPMIFGQFGFIGLIIVVCIYYLLFKNIAMDSKNLPLNCKVSIYILIIMLFVNSISSSSFVHYHAICYAILISAALNYNFCNNEEYQTKLIDLNNENVCITKIS